jgi:hypothetical protein
MGWGDCERTERRLALRALRAGWDVPAERRPGLIAVAMGLAEDPAVPPRERLAALESALEVRAGGEPGESLAEPAGGAGA